MKINKLYRKNIFILVLVLLSNISIKAQVYSVSGYVTDVQTKDPIPYSNCYMQLSHVGTITNNDGHFVLKFNREILPDTLVVKCIGYKSVKIPVFDSLKETTIELRPSSVELKEITITEKAGDLKQFMQEVLSSRLTNYYPTPHVATAYYRGREEILYKGQKTTDREVEMALTIQTPLKKRVSRGGLFLLFNLDEQLFLNGLRVSEFGEINPHPEFMKKDIFTDYNPFGFLLISNMYLYKSFLEYNSKRLTYKLEKIDTAHEGNTEYHIFVFDKQKKLCMKIIVDKESKAIYEYETFNSTHAVCTHQRFIFRKKDDKMIPVYFSYSESSTEEDYIFKQTGEILFYEIKNDNSNTPVEGIKVNPKKIV